MDCDFGCNGTCKFDCSNPTPECLGLCEAAGGPTAAPTGTAIDPSRNPFSQGSGADSKYWQTKLFVVVGLLLCCLIV